MQPPRSKTKMFALGFASFGVLFALAGCSIKSEEPDKYPDKSAYCTGRARAECNADVVANCAAPDVDRCIAQRSTVCVTAIPLDTTYLPKQADGCIAAVAAAFADARLKPAEIKSYEATCLLVFDGKTEVGGTCSKDVDCKVSAGLRCLVSPGQPTGTCQVPKPAQGGEKCDTPDAQCASGFHCGATKHCDADGSDGEACSGAAPCGAASTCSSTMSCKPKPPDGSTCNSDEDCLNHLCDKAQDATTGICASQITLAPNEAFCTAIRPSPT
jgi:hypothetical protein